jgi:hypothetical protein
MTGSRYKRLGAGSPSSGELVYERSVPDSHFLRHLDRLVKWGRFSERLIRLYELDFVPPRSLHAQMQMWPRDTASSG